MFWACSKKSEILKLRCEDMGSHETEGPKAELNIEFVKGKYSHSYGLRHTIPTVECRDLVSRIRGQLNKQSDFCIRGQLATETSSEIGWVFQEFQAGNVSVCENDDCIP